jgi:hypothetical protein
MFRKDASAHEVRSIAEPRFTDPSVPSRACCCPGRPVVKVIMPPTTDRAHSVDLWLCGHHYRESLAALLASKAIVEDLTITATDHQRAECPAAAS